MKSALVAFFDKLSGGSKAKPGFNVAEKSIEDDVMTIDSVTSGTGAAVEAHGLPTQVIIGFLDGVDHKDADSFVRGQMKLICQDVNNAGYAIKKFRTGFAYEIKEGGSRGSWLDSILKTLVTDREVLIPTGTRMVRVSMGEAGIACNVLPVNPDESTANAKPPKAHGALNPYHAYVQKWLPPAISFFAISMILFLGSLSMVYLVDGDKRDQQIRKMQADIDSLSHQLPISQVPKVLPDNKHIAKIEFKEGAWQPILYNDNAVPAAPAQADLPTVNTPAPRDRAADPDIESFIQEQERNMRERLNKSGR